MTSVASLKRQEGFDLCLQTVTLINYMLFNRIAYGLKNFKDHMGIRNSFTISGLLRRSERRNPRLFLFLRRVLTMGGVCFALLNLVPGSNLPLQTQARCTVYGFERISSWMWFYNPVNPQAGEYLIKLSEIVLQAMDNQVYSPQMLSSYFQEMREVIEQNKRDLRSSNYLDLLLYGQIMLQNVIRYEKTLLLDRIVLEHYNWLYKTVFKHLSDEVLFQKDTSHIKLVFVVVQYLLNFSPSVSIPGIVSCLKETAKKSQKEGCFAQLVMKRGLEEDQFKKSLMKLYNQHSLQVKSDIMEIFNRMDEIYKKTKTNQ